MVEAGRLLQNNMTHDAQQRWKTVSREGGFLLLTALGMLWAHLLLQLSPVFCLPVGFWYGFAGYIHRKRKAAADEDWKQLEEVFLYMELLLYAFGREGKVSRSLADVSRGLPEGTMKQVVEEALTLTESSYEDALGLIEKAYPCKKLLTIHSFLRKVERYGGESSSSIRILLMDKSHWEKQLREDRRQRSNMFRQIFLSCMASLLICSVLLFLPIGEMEIASVPLVQCMTAVLLIADDLILLKAQSYLRIEWRDIEERKTDKPGKSQRNRMTDYKNYDRKTERRRSLLAALLPALLLCFGIYRHNLWLAAVGVTLLPIFLNLHHIGRRLAYRKLKQEIEAEFPGWLLEVTLLLQGDNVHTAFARSLPQAPPVLQEELQLMLRRMELDPEGADPYHRFLEEFQLPSVHMSMCSLYEIAEGMTEDGNRQLQELVEADLELLDYAEAQKRKEEIGGMYGLFLLPVLTASAKLVTDMTVFLLGFLARGLL